jgi:hypothetical protein
MKNDTEIRTGISGFKNRTQILQEGEADPSPLVRARLILINLFATNFFDGIFQRLNENF